MLFLLLVIIIGLSSYLVFIFYDLNQYAKRLSLISQEDTNQELRMGTRIPGLVKITILNNQVLQKQKQLRFQLHQEKKQLEQAIHNISHDLRTPLTVADGYTQILASDRSMDEEQKALLQKIATNLSSVEEHLEQLLDYQRLNENQVQLELAKVSVSRLVEQELLSFYQSFQAADWQLDVSIEKEVVMITDPQIMTRILQNLFGNMLKHGIGPGAIELRQTSAHINLVVKNAYQGVIQHPERLTERFYTEDLARQSKNSGLGLFIVHELVTRLDGKLSIHVSEQQFEIAIQFNKKR
ncbi:MAG: sensor histidine kinase [Enterococcus sp.]